MADFAGQLISTRADKKMIFDDNVYDNNHSKLVSDILKDIPSSGLDGYKVTVAAATTATEGYLKTYEVKQNNSVVGKIDIPKDFLVKSGSVVKGTWSGSTFTPSETGSDKALALVLNVKEGSAADDTIYINVTELGKVYTNGDGISISDKNVVSVKKNSNSETYLTVNNDGISVTGVDDAIKTAVNGASYLTNVKVNGVTGTVSNKISSLTLKGKDVAVADSYTNTVYSSPFNDKVTAADAHVAASDKVDKALGKVEKTVSLLVDEVLDNEAVNATAINQLANAAGTIGVDDAIGYQAESSANFISTAYSVHNATVLLDTALKTAKDDALTLDTSADNALTLKGKGLYLSSTIDCGTY